MGLGRLGGLALFRLASICRLLAASFLVASSIASGASVRPLGLDDLVDTSALALQGTCVGNRVEREEATGFVVTYTTFVVKDVLKGQAATTHVIKQVGGRLPSGEGGYRVDGVPTFAVGEEYVVFLAGVSSAGFSSPIGLAQGKFTVRKDVAGEKVANGRDFREMTAGMSGVALPETLAKSLAGTAPVTRLGLEEFKQLVRARLGRAK